MKTRLLLLLFGLFVCGTLSAQDNNGRADLRDNTIAKKTLNEVQKAEKIFTENFHTPGGIEELQLMLDKVLVVYNDNIDFTTFNSQLERVSGLKELEAVDVVEHKRTAFVALRNIKSKAKLDAKIAELNALPSIKYVQPFYLFNTGRYTAPTNEILVGLKPGGDTNYLSNLIGSENIASIEVNKYDQNLVTVELVDNALHNIFDINHKISKSGKFKYNEPNMYTLGMYTTTNDPFVNDQWSLNNDGSIAGSVADVDMDVFEAWAITSGNAGIKVAVIDGGVDLDHPDLIANLLPGFDATGGGSAGDNAGGGDDHGTNCAGIIAAMGDNNLGVAGVAHSVKIIPIRGLVNGSGTFVDLTDAVNIAWQNGADVLSNSWGGGVNTPGAMAAAIDNAITMGRGGLGSPSLFSSGNGDFFDVTAQSPVGAPAEYDNSIAVGAIDHCGLRIDNVGGASCQSWGGDQGSQFGSALDVVAPGINIFSTANVGNGNVGGDFNSNFGGTSAACPNAAGVMALILSVNPTLTEVDARAILEGTTKKIGGYGYAPDPAHPNGTWHEEVGHGLVNALDAVVLANTGPQMLFDPSSISLTVTEALGCEVFTDYDLNIRITNDYTGTDDPVGTINVGAGSSAVEGVDFDFVGGNTVTFTGGIKGTKVLTVRVYNDLVVEADETIDFELTLNAGNTNVVLPDVDSFKEMTWTVEDAPPATDLPIVSFVSVAPPATTCVQNGDFTLTLTLDIFPDETSWDIVDAANTIIASGGPYNRPADNQITLVIPIVPTLVDGDYTLNIRDSFGDGLVTGTPDGSYSLENADGVVVASGGGNNRFSLDATDFCVGPIPPSLIDLNGPMFEALECTDAYTDYIIGVNIDNCVEAEQDVIVTTAVDAASTAVEGVDFDFIGGNSVLFTGEVADMKTLTIRVYNDGDVEGGENLLLNLEVSEPTLVDVSTEAGSSDFTIIDADSPTLELTEVDKIVAEAPYDCSGDNNTFMLEVNVGASCATITNDLELTVTVGAGSTATEGVDFDFINTTVPVSTTGPTILEVVTYQDYLAEDTETLIIDLEVSSGIASLITSSANVSILDSQGSAPPSATMGITADFESGTLVGGWAIVSNKADPNNEFTVSGNTDLDGNAAHISNDPNGTQAYEFSNATGTTEVHYLLSPVFSFGVGAIPIDFLYQMQGSIFDTGNFGVVSGSVDVSDFAAIDASFVASSLISLINEPTGSSLQSLVPGYDLGVDLGGAFPGQQVRLAFQQVLTTVVTTNPPLAVDNISVENVLVTTSIESNVMAGDEIPSYPIFPGSDTYYYNKLDSDIALLINSSVDQGCTTGYVDMAGQGAVRFISDKVSEFRADKTFLIETDSPEFDANLAMGLYYTELEIAGWEATSGSSRDDLYMFKTAGSSVYDIDSLCIDYTDIDFAKATLIPYSNGFRVSANFDTGLESITGFGISTLPSYTPGRLYAVQNKDQVDITFSNHFDESNIDYYEVQVVDPVSGEATTLIIVPADGSGSYSVTHFYPEIGINTYRLRLILKDGTVYTICNDTSVQFVAEGDLKLYPNPATDVINVVLSDDGFKDVVGINVYDAEGQLVVNQDVDSKRGVLRWRLDISSLAVGTYYVSLVSTSGEQKAATFVKVN